mmetsp:Transcript_805/g.1219  ORF Transcript_805/g.1219 Transcript_805/m.1219 type:complete len:105 (-) Transcript_805:502-816(-)
MREIGSIDILPNIANTFPVERSRLIVYGGVLPNNIGQRIVVCLKDVPITIVSKRSYKLCEVSLDRDVHFNIKLYKEMMCRVSEGCRVMVELQKRSRCLRSILYN